MAIPPAPPPAPSAGAVANERDFRKLVDGSLATTQKSAEAWRTGAAALVALLTAGLFIKGPEEASELSTGWRALLTGVFGLGMTCALGGLWEMLKAAAGTPAAAEFEDLVDNYGSIKGAEIYAADQAAKHIETGRNLIITALVVLLAGLGLWWWAPVEQPKAVVKVTVGDEVICGSLSSGDEQTLVVKVDGRKNPVEIAFDTVDNLHTASSCD